MALFNRGGRWVWVAVSAVVMILVLAFLDRGKDINPAATPLGAWETDPAVWGRSFPREYQSWRQARDPATIDIGHGPGRTKWGGSGRPRRASSQLFAGYSFASQGTEISEPSGHPVGCQACHDPKTMALRLSQPVFLDALTQRRIDPAGLSPQTLKSYVCAQCHATRFLGWQDGQPTIPFTAEGIVAQSEQAGPVDWRHAASGVPLLKLHHPEFELWSLGNHAARGVTCVDCHMPYRAEGSQRFTDHRMKSPLLDVNSHCGACHRWGEREIRARVEAIQDTTMALQQRAAAALLGAHRAVHEARQGGVPDDPLKAIRALIRQAQTRWEFIASEHSTGFHAPQEAAEQLGIAIDQARQAEILAKRVRSKVAD
jgi:formate-dependent nitrite reductase cytochrome c552 subunit